MWGGRTAPKASTQRPVKPPTLLPVSLMISLDAVGFELSGYSRDGNMQLGCIVEGNAGKT